MKLLPPKPPKPEGTEKTVKKQTDDDIPGSTLSDVPEAPEVPEVTEVPELSDLQEDEILKQQDDGEKSKNSDNILPDLPPAVPEGNSDAEELLPPEVSEKSEVYRKTESGKSDENKEKKKGLFSKLFRKKEIQKQQKQDNKADFAEPAKEESQDDIKKFEDADSNLDDLSKALEKSIGDAQSLEKIASIDDNIVPAPVQEAKIPDQKYDSKYKKYAPGKSWDDEITELPDIAAPVGLADKKYSKYDGSKKYAKETISKDSSRDETKSGGKLEIEEINLDKEWSEESDFVPQEENKIEEPKKKEESKNAVKNKEKENHGKKEKAKVSKKESERLNKDDAKENASEESHVGQETEKQAPSKQEISKNSAKLTDLEGMNLSGQINEWKEKSVSVASAKQKPDKKAMQHINSRLRKLLKLYENKLIKIAAEKKKSILLEINRVNKKEIELENRVNRKEAELERKEKATQSKEVMLVSLEKSLGERKAELDTLVSQEATLTVRKESLQAEISDLRKKSSELKTEIINNQKLFDSQKRTIFQETKNLQDNFKGLKDNFDNEKRKGDKRLADIEKKCTEAQLELDELLKKSRKVAVQLKAKEDALHQKEKEVMELISQEKKILSLLKGNEEKGLTADDIKARRRAKERKPATVIGFGGEPEIYDDDEETLNRKINECKELIRESNYDDAKEMYNHIREEFMSAVLEDDSRKAIRHELRELYDDIALKMISQK